jgi:hypothetical protein
MKFTWSSGQRPLDGFTLKRGVGCGGFGEVYYALSDGGKEVALKLVRGNADIEMRGIAQCLNLKHPHLVALYDLKTDHHGDHWVVMEYVAGEPLNTVLNRHPNGLPPELAQQWFLALARAVGYLHDHGIVHRDLKPGNIFLENGILKIGDYGLSKFISGSQRTAQTQSVGTVYYMAPEISTGNYNKQIDAYAAGIILYEMLSGRVPFDGESAGEILMKHLTSPPDLSKLPAEYIPIVGKALAKNPAQRYASIGEMAKAVEAVGAPQPQPAPAPLPTPMPFPLNRPVGKFVDQAPASVPGAPSTPLPARKLVGELSGSMALAALLALFLVTLYVAIRHDGSIGVYEAGSVFFLTVAVCWSVLVPAKIWDGRPGDSAQRRLVMMVLGVFVGAGAVWLSGQIPFLEPGMPPYGTPGQSPPIVRVPLVAADHGQLAKVAGSLSYFALALCIVRWWRMADRHRSVRFSAWPVLVTGFWALVLLPIWPAAEPFYGTIALVTASVIVQWVSPWEAPPPPLAKRMRLRYA